MMKYRRFKRMEKVLNICVESKNMNLHSYRTYLSLQIVLRGCIISDQCFLLWKHVQNAGFNQD